MNTTWIPKTIVCMSAAVGLWACQDSGQSAHEPLLDVGAADVGAVDVADSVDPTVSQIAITPDPVVLVQNGSLQAVAEVRDQFDEFMPSAAVSWDIRDSAVASVTDDGTVNAHEVGQTTLLAASHGSSTRVMVRVEEVGRVEIVPNQPEIGVGETLDLHAIVYSIGGHRIGAADELGEQTTLAQWQSDSADVAPIDQRGQLTGRRPILWRRRCASSRSL